MLAPELAPRDIFIDARSIKTGRKHGRIFRGGLNSYTRLRRDLILWMKQDDNAESWFTTMVDLYRLPTDFPGRTECANAEASRRVECLEQEFARDIRQQLLGSRVHERFIPYIQLHEFESLLFANPEMFLEAFPDRQPAVEQLHAIRDMFECPEDINEGETTAPSKRILNLFPDFEKPVSGLLIARQIGLPALRQECPHFNDWICRILQSVPE